MKARRLISAFLLAVILLGQIPAGASADAGTTANIRAAEEKAGGKAGSPDTLTISGEMTWADSSNIYKTRPEKVKITLYKVVDETNTICTTTEAKPGSNSNIWEYEFTDLPKSEGGKEIKYIIEPDEISGYESVVTEYNIQNNLETVDLYIEKLWQDDNNQKGTRPQSVTVSVSDTKKSEPVATQVITPDGYGNWNYTFIGLPKFDSKGVEIHYTVNEEKEPRYKDPVIEKLDGRKEEFAFSITNTLDTLDISVSMTWEDGESAYRPDTVNIKVMNGENEAASHMLSQEDDWKCNFTGLPRYDAKGTAINYTVTQDTLNGYTCEITSKSKDKGRGMTASIVNTIVSGSVSGEKIWHDDNDKYGLRPKSVTIRLLDNNNKEIASKEVTEADGWKYKFTNLPTADKNGNTIIYKVTEDKITGYNGVVSGNNLENTIITKTISGVKSWDDFDNKYSTRPDKITVQAVDAQDKVWASQEVIPDESGWNYTFADLPAVSREGTAISYKIREEAVCGYEANVVGNNIENKLLKTNIKITNSWTDSDNYYNTRPATIAVTLYADGEEKETVQINSNGSNREYVFANYPAKNKSTGQDIVYTISVASIMGYTTTVEGLNIANTLETVNIQGEKTWNDNGNKYNTRPAAITVMAVGDNGLVENQIVSEIDGRWIYNFTNLPKTDPATGNEIVYTIQEKKVIGYSQDEGTGNGSLVNTLETIAVSGEIIWLSDVPTDRSENVTLKLYAGGQFTGETIQVSAQGDENWTYTFKELPKYYSNGGEINYTVSEENVPGYRTYNSGRNVINTLITYDLYIGKKDLWGVGLEGSELVMTTADKDGNTVTVASWTSDANGLYKVTGLRDMVEYTVNETKAPFGYNPVSKPVVFYIDEIGTVKVKSDGTVNNIPEAVVISGVLWIINDTVNVTSAVPVATPAPAPEPVIVPQPEAIPEPTAPQATPAPAANDTDVMLQAIATSQPGSTPAPAAAEQPEIAPLTAPVPGTGKIIIKKTVNGNLREDMKGNAAFEIKDEDGKTIGIYTVKNYFVKQPDGSYAMELNVKAGKKYIIAEKTGNTQGYYLVSVTNTVDGKAKEAPETDAFEVSVNQTVNVEFVDVYAKNVRIPVIKVGAKDTLRLDGAEFDVYQVNGPKVSSIISSSKEIHYIEGIEPNVEYAIVEVKAPEGYQVITAPIVFMVDVSGNVTLLDDAEGMVEVLDSGILAIRNSKKPGT